MRNLKKVLALVLAMAMALSLAVTAGAAFNDQDKIVNTEAVDMCSALGIINGYTDGSFKPEGNVTRAEAAKMITIALNGGKEPTLSASATPTYTDIAGHWAAKYIEYCTSLGIVAGDGAGKFNPNGNVKAVELAKMLLIAIGYDAAAEKFVGANWDTNVNVVASQKDLYEELETIDPSVAATRDVAAQMVWNALNVLMVDYDYKLTTDANGNLVSELKVEDIPNTTLLTKKFNTENTKETTGMLTGITYDSDEAEYTYTVAGDKYVTEANYTELLGHNVTVVVQKETAKVFGIFANEEGVVVSGIAGDIEVDTDVIEVNDVEYDAKGVVYAEYGFNGTYWTYTSGKALADAEKYEEFVAIDNDDDKDIDLVIYYPVDFATVNYVGKDYINTTAGKLKAEDYSIYEGAAKDDYVLISSDLSLVTDGIVTEVEKQTGKIESRTGDNVTIDGTVYNYSLVKSEVEANMNNSVDFYAYNGYLKSVVAATSVDISDFAVVTKIAAAAGMTGPQAKLLFTDGTEQIVDLAEDYTDATGTKISVSDLVVYDVKDGEYTLRGATSSDLDDFDAYLTSKGTAAWDNADSASDANAKVIFEKQSAKFAADAIVFVWDGADEFTVETGATVAKVTGSAKVHAAGADKNATNALTVTFAYIETAGVSDSEAVYGYVVSDVTFSQNADKETFETVTIWNGTENVELTTVADYSFGKIAKGSLVSYKIDADGAVSFCEIVAAGDAAALTVIDDEFVTIEGAEKALEIDEDTVVLYVDATETVGEEGGAISVATEAEKTVDGKTVLYNVANVKYIAVDGVLKLLVVDVDNDWNGDLDA